MHLLVIEDDRSLGPFLKEGLEQAGFSVELVATSRQGRRRCLEGTFDAVVLDVNLPDGDGIELLSELRSASFSTPVLILSARRETDDKVRGLMTGGDDYLTKPFAFAELEARLTALVRRSKSSSVTTVLTYGGLELDAISRVATFEGQPIELQPLEFNLLKFLMENSDRIVTKARLIQSVWKFNFNPSTNIVEVRMSKLREKLDEVGARHMITAVRGVGYKFSCRD